MTTISFGKTDRPENALAARSYRIPTMPSEDCEREYLELTKRWASLNGLRVAEPFELGTLARGAGRARDSDVWDIPRFWHGRRHPLCFNRHRHTAAMTIEPYEDTCVGDGIKALEARGLTVRVPPNPYASFWYPGSTLFIVITRPDFGEIRWLRDQLDFDGGRAPPPFLGT